MNKLSEIRGKIYKALNLPAPQFSVVDQAKIVAVITITFCLLYFVNLHLGNASILLIAPFIATLLIIFSMPGNAMNSASAILQSYVLCSLISFAIVYAFDYSQWTIVAAFSISFFLMMLLNCVHPPAIMLTFIIAGEHMRDYTLAFNPIALDVLILIIAVAIVRKILPDIKLLNSSDDLKS